MKKILFLVFGVALLGLSSCFELDNWAEPSSTWEGTVIDSYTNKPILSSQNDWQIRIWERSWKGQEKGATAAQDLRIKQDGTYKNTSLFDGTYDMILYNGPHWLVDTIKGLELKKNLKYDITVTPYVQVVDFKPELYQGEEIVSGKPTGKMLDSIKVTFRVRAPLLVNDKGLALPQLYEVRAFLSLTDFCGAGTDSSIGVSEYTQVLTINNNLNEAKGFVVRPAINANFTWAKLLEESSDNTTQVITLSSRVKSGYTYSVRVGAAVNDSYKKYCYSPILKVTVP